MSLRLENVPATIRIPRSLLAPTLDFSESDSSNLESYFTYYENGKTQSSCIPFLRTQVQGMQSTTVHFDHARVWYCRHSFLHDTSCASSSLIVAVNPRASWYHSFLFHVHDQDVHKLQKRPPIPNSICAAHECHAPKFLQVFVYEMLNEKRKGQSEISLHGK